MLTFLSVFVVALVFAAWLCAVGWLCTQAIDRESWAYGGAAAVVCAVGMAVVGTVAISEREDARLCLRGHQEWVSTLHPTTIVGRVVIPQHQTSRKRWVCEAWEGQR